jgi:PAS domain S-box-containing protein
VSDASNANVNRYVVTVAVLAMLAVAGIGWQQPGSHSPTMTVIFALCFVVVGFLPVPIPRGRELYLFRFDEAVTVPMVLALAGTDATAAAALGTIISLLIARVEAVKVVFNTALTVIGVSTCSAIVTLIAGESRPGPSGLAVAGVVLGMFAAFVVTEVLMAGILSRAGGARSTWQLVWDDVPMRGVMSSSNIAVGLLLVLPAFEAPWLLVGTLLPLLVLHSAYRAHVERAYEDEHLSNIRTYAHGLMESLRVEDAAMGLVRSARELVGADRVELRIRGHRFAFVSGHREEGPVDTAELPTMPARRATDIVLQMRGRSDLDATLTVRSSRTNVGETAFTDRERILLDMLSRQAQIGLDNAMLFQRVTAEKTTLAQIFEHSTEGLLVVAEDGTVVTWNPAMTVITGFSEHQMTGSPIGLLAPGLADIAAEGTAGQLEARITTNGGQSREISAAYAPIPPTDSGDQTQRMSVVVVNDVTSRSEAERLKNDFVATVSHELRTPLTAIKGFVETMRRDDIVVSPTRFPLFLEIMNEQTDRLDRLISDLLDVSAIESGRPIKLDPQPTDLREVVDMTVEVFRAARPSAEVEIECEPGLVVWVDPHRLQQVLTNLLDNSFKHAGPVDPIEIVCRTNNHARAAGEPASVQVLVRDCGPGIAEADLESIFDRFFFTSDSVTRYGGGAGLGLFICRQLVEAMNGRISCHSEIGVGATFTIDLPGSDGSPRARSGIAPSVLELDVELDPGVDGAAG